MVNQHSPRLTSHLLPWLPSSFAFSQLPMMVHLMYLPLFPSTLELTQALEPVAAMGLNASSCSDAGSSNHNEANLSRILDRECLPEKPVPWI